MRRRTATLLVCGPLVAGCGTATRLQFAGHSRPATPVDVSVYSGPGTVQLNPDRLRPGLVVFNIANESGHWQRFAVLRPSGRAVAHTAPIADGATAQIKATLRGPRYAFSVSSRRAGGGRYTYARLDVSGPPRNGNSQLMQP